MNSTAYPSLVSAGSKLLLASDVTASEAGVAVGQSYVAELHTSLDIARGATVTVEAIIPAGESSEFGAPVLWEAVCYRCGEQTGRLGVYYFLSDFTRV
jgi:hypothetical protein